MPSTYSPLKIELPATGEQSGTWGNTTNTNLGTALEEAITGSANVTFSSGNVTLTLTDTNASQVARNLRLNLIGVTGGSTRTLTVPAIKKLYLVSNNCADSVIVGNSTGATVTVPAGNNIFIYNDGTDVLNAITYITALNAATVAAGSVTTTQVDIVSQGDLRLQDTTGGQYVALQAPGTVASSYTLTLPVDDGTNGQALITDGNGVLSWSTAASGDVYGPASATDNAIARFDLTTGKIIQNSGVIIDDSNNITGAAAITTTGVLTVPAGTVSAPAITTTGDTNTGIFFPAADTIAFAEGGVESMRINSSGFLGIGTNNPARSLTIQTPASNYVSRFIASTNNFALMEFANNANNNNDAIIGTVAANTLAFYTNGFSERMRIDSSGNVSIGTTAAPYGGLTILAGDAFTQYFNNTSGVTGADGFTVGLASDNNAYVFNRENSNLIFGTNAAERMRITNAGRIGIGTTAPSYSIQLNGENVTGGIFIQDSNSASASPVFRVQGNRVDTNGSQCFAGGLVLERYQSSGTGGVVAGNWLGNIYFGGNYDATPNFTYSASIAAVAEANWTSTSAAAAAIAFLTGTSGTALGTPNAGFGTERMRITSAGNVGIGTSSPAANTRLTLEDTQTVKLVLRGGSTQNGILLNAVSTSAQYYIGSGLNLLGTGDRGFLIYDVTSARPKFFVEEVNGETRIDATTFLRYITNNAERMRITSAGRVGIGTSSPNQLLDVSTAGEAIIAVTSTAAGGKQYNFISSPTGGLGTGVFSIYDRTGTASRIAINNDGLVAIGNMVTPEKRLTVFDDNASTTTTTGIVITNNSLTTNSRSGIAFKNFDNYGAAIWSPRTGSALGNLVFATNGGAGIAETNAVERMRIDSNGKVGIATPIPFGVLEVISGGQNSGANPTTFPNINIVQGADTINANGGLDFRGSAFGAGYGFRMSAIDSSGVHLVFGNRQNSTTFTEVMRIDSSGNLLVGTTSVTGAGGFSIRPNLGGAGTYCRLALNSNGTNDVFEFLQNGTQVGRIQIAATQTFYVTTSDYRLKENIAPMTGALAKVTQLKPCTYTWKSNGSNGQGFIAHELAEVCPEAVVGKKDEVNKDGSINPQGIDTSFLVATLTAAIQEQQALITSLTARIAALESK
jgi:hypothetical protein